MRAHVNGNPSKTDVVLMMHTRGVSEAEIASRIDCKPHEVRQMIRARSASSGSAAEMLFVSRETRDMLRPHARARDIPVSRLMLDLIDTIAADGLVTAILGDPGHER